MKFVKIAGISGLMGVFIMVIFGCASGDGSFSPAEVIQQALEETEAMKAYYVEAEMVTYENDQEQERILLKEWVNEDGKRRTETENEDGSEQTITVNDGAKLISYQPEEKLAFVIDDSPDLLALNQLSPKQQAEKLLEMIQTSHDISEMGEEEIAGRDTYHLQAKVKNGKTTLFGDQELWIDKENWMVLKMITTVGDMKAEVVYTNVNFDPEITAETFTLDLPDDVVIQDLEEMSEADEVTLAEAVDQIAKPFLYFPEKDGLAISRIELLDLKGELNRKEVNIEYVHDGLAYLTLTVFASPADTEAEMSSMPGEEPITIRGHEGSFMEMGDFRSISWQEEGMNYTLILHDPNLTDEEVTALTEAMVPAESTTD